MSLLFPFFLGILHVICWGLYGAPISGVFFTRKTGDKIRTNSEVFCWFFARVATALKWDQSFFSGPRNFDGFAKMGAGWCGRLLGSFRSLHMGGKLTAKSSWKLGCLPQKGCSSMGPAVSFTTLCIFAFLHFLVVRLGYRNRIREVNIIWDHPSKDVYDTSWMMSEFTIYKHDNDSFNYILYMSNFHHKSTPEEVTPKNTHRLVKGRWQKGTGLRVSLTSNPETQLDNECLFFGIGRISSMVYLLLV